MDSSVVVASLVDTGSDGRWFREVVTEAGYVVAPHLLIAESLNVLRRLELNGDLTQFEAAAAQADLHQLKIELLPIRPFEARIWELRHNLTCYNAWYVAIAEAMELRLATLDSRLAAAPGPRCEILQPKIS